MTDTMAALEEAIQRHVATTYQGELVDSWILVACSQLVEEHTISSYRMITPETQAHHVDAGLAAVGERIIRDSWDSALDGGLDDDDD